MKAIIRVIIGLSLISYPLIIFFGLKYFSIKSISLFLLVLFILRLIIIRKTDQVSVSIGCIGCVLMFLGFFSANQLAVLLYPVMISFTLLVFFVVSILYPPTIIEKIARLTDKNFTEQAVPYTKKVTLVWSLFFFINGIIAAYTVYLADLKIWTLYNGLISYVIIGAIFLIEYIIRQKVKKHYGE